MLLTMKNFGVKLEQISYIQRPGAYAFILSDNQILLINIEGRIYLPGGGLENNETHEEGLTRELLEETGYKIKINQKITEANQYLYSNFRQAHFHKIGHFYHCSLLEKSQSPTDLNHNIIWSPLHEAPKLLKQEFQSWALDYFIKNHL